MKLPNADKAIVEFRKVTDYLLNAAHPDNGGKAKFFVMLGFSTAKPEALRETLRMSAQSIHSSKRVESQHGVKYVVEAQITGPSGKSAMVRLIWVYEWGSDAPRLVTAYPQDV